MLLGSKMTEESKRKLRLKNLGKSLSEETKEKFKGNQYAKGHRHTEATKQKIKEHHLNFIFTLEHRKKISLGKIGKKSSYQTRCKQSLIRGGTGIPYELEDYPLEYVLIRDSIIKRDNYICQICRRNDKLSVHHIDKNKLNNNINNLVTLCFSCHSKLHRGGFRYE